MYRRTTILYAIQLNHNHRYHYKYICFINDQSEPTYHVKTINLKSDAHYGRIDHMTTRSLIGLS